MTLNALMTEINRFTLCVDRMSSAFRTFLFSKQLFIPICFQFQVVVLCHEIDYKIPDVHPLCADRIL